MASTIQTPSYTPAPGNTDDKNVESHVDEGVAITDGTQAPNAAGASKTGKQDPFGKDSAGPKGGPNALSGEVGNKEPLDADFGALKQAFEANGVAAPTEQDVRNTAGWAQSHPQVQGLVDGVKQSVKTGGAPPSVHSYAAVPPPANDPAQTARDIQKAIAQNIINKIGENKKTDGKDAVMKNGSVSSLIMFVMLQAKKELQADKKDDLERMKKFTTMSDLMNQHMSNVLLPAQQDLQKQTVDKPKDKDKVTTSVDTPQSFNLDFLGKADDGSPKLLSDYGKDKDGKANPTTQKVTQAQMSSIMTNFQNELQQVQSRVQREQTSYQGHDSQDSTLSNIITATNKTFSDSASAIIRNVQS